LAKKAADEATMRDEITPESVARMAREEMMADFDKAANPNAKKWQYMGINFRFERMSDVMTGFNQMGAKGWELIICTNSMGMGMAIFKRELKHGIKLKG
jgi:hypothetical protein